MKDEQKICRFSEGNGNTVDIHANRDLLLGSPEYQQTLDRLLEEDARRSQGRWNEEDAGREEAGCEE